MIHAVRNGPDDRDHADKLFKDAIAMEASMDAPSGPVEPIKPSFELYGEFLLAQGRAKDASAQFERLLELRLGVLGASLREQEFAVQLE